MDNQAKNIWNSFRWAAARIQSRGFSA